MALIQWKQIEGDLSGSRVLTGSLSVSGSIDLTGSLFINNTEFVDLSIFKKTGSYYATTNDLQVTGSLYLDLNGVEDYFAVTVAGQERFKINEEGVTQYTPFSSTPTAVTGGLFYSSSDAYFLGFEN